MLTEAVAFVDDVLSGLATPRWLSYVGKSGTGKTFLCDIILAECAPTLRHHPDLLNGVQRIGWTSFLRKLRAAEYFRLDDAADANLLLIDDIGTASDTAFSLEQLYALIELRNRKWTLLTSNLTLPEIGERFDARIASRLIRDLNVCVEVDTLDFALRQGKQRSPWN